MTKIAINRCFGGFGLSQEAYWWLFEHGIPVLPDHQYESSELAIRDDRQLYGLYAELDNYRSHPTLIACIEALGERANGPCSRLKIEEVADDLRWEIVDFDGMERLKVY